MSRPVARVAVLLAGLLAVPATAWAAAPVADYQMPFTCNEKWTGDSRSYHSPSALSIDWNRENDLGAKVLAPAPGVVSKVENLGSRSYGLYVVLDHGNGETTLFAHLSAEFVSVGQRVDAGEVIALLGSSGGSSGPHLHFEERRNGTVVQSYFDGVAFKYPATLASKNCPDVPAVGDWDNDGKDDLGTFSHKTYGWFNKLVGTTVTKVRTNGGNDLPLVGDFDGDGRTDIGVRRATVGQFVLVPAKGGAATTITLGAVDDKPVTGDWNGDGTTDIGFWRPSTRTFSLRAADGTIRKVVLGATGNLPVTGDWNGDRVTDLGVFDPTTATWSLRMVAQDSTVWTATVKLGAVGDLPATGDWNGDGTTDLGTWTPSTARWTQRYAATTTGGAARLVTKTFGTAR